MSESLTPSELDERWTIEAKARKPVIWIRLLRKIRDKHIRGKCASLVWWDYCPQSKALMRVMAGYQHGLPDDPAAVFAGLRGVGYPENRARRRCVQPKDSTYRPNSPLVEGGKGSRL